jgi:hypothetical protein
LQYLNGEFRDEAFTDLENYKSICHPQFICYGFNKDIFDSRKILICQIIKAAQKDTGLAEQILLLKLSPLN